jgi:hypothetical protein
MANLPALVLGASQGNQQNIGAADALLVGTGIDCRAAGALSVGASTATSVTLGQHTFLGDSKELRFGNALGAPDLKVYSNGTDGVVSTESSAGAANLILRTGAGGTRYIQAYLEDTTHYFEVALDGSTSIFKVPGSSSGEATWNINDRHLTSKYTTWGTTSGTDLRIGYGTYGSIESRNDDLYISSDLTMNLNSTGVLYLNNSVANGAVSIGNSNDHVTINGGAVTTAELQVVRPSTFSADIAITSSEKIKWPSHASPTCQVYGQTHLYLQALAAGTDIYSSVTSTGWLYYTLGTDDTTSRMVIRNSSLVELFTFCGESAAPSPPSTYAGKLTLRDNVALALGTFGSVEDLALYTDGTNVWSVKNLTAGTWYFDNVNPTTAIVFRMGDNAVGSTIQFRSDNDTQIFTIYGDATGQFNGHLLFPDNKELRIGTGSDLVIKHDGVDTTVTGAVKFNSDVTLGDASTDTITLTAYVSPGLTFKNGASERIVSVQASAVDTEGVALVCNAGAAGAASAAAGKVGGQARIRAGAGSAGTAVLQAGTGGALYLYGGAAGTNNGGGGASGGNVYINAGAATGTNENGDVYIGNTSVQTDHVEIGASDVDTLVVGKLAHEGSLLGFYDQTPTSQAADMGALTDSTGGAVDGTLVAISGTGDDANINNNYADLINRVNAIRTCLRNLGLMA